MTNPDQEQVGKQDDGNKDGALMAHQSQAEARGVNEQEEESSSSSYFCSYLFVELTFSLVLMIVALILEFGNISPRKRPIPFQQLSSSGEYIPNPVINETTAAKKGDETFSDVELILYAILLPYLIQLVLSYFNRTMHAITCVYLSSVGLTIIGTDVLKSYVGYLRPIFYELCQPNDDYTSCTSDDESEGRLSFPSGHASMAFSGLLILSMYLERNFGVSKQYNEYQKQQWARLANHNNGDMPEVPSSLSPSKVKLSRVVSILCYTLPMTLAAFIAASRVADNHHFPADVVGGAALGAFVSYAIFNLWFPSNF